MYMWSKLQTLHQTTVKSDLPDDFDYLNITHIFFLCLKSFTLCQLSYMIHML